jgi:hypothetical protein
MEAFLPPAIARRSGELGYKVLDLSLSRRSGLTVMMGDDGCALFRAQPQELLPGEANPPASVFQRYGGKILTELAQLASQLLNLADPMCAPAFHELVT